MSDQLRNKMYHYEVSPPQGLWNKITTSLNEQEAENEISSKLANLEIPPPSSAWQHINAALEKDIKIPHSKHKTLFYILRFAAAAVILALMIFGGIRIIKNNSGNNEVASTKNTSPSLDSSAPSANKSVTEVPLIHSAESDEERDNAALEESKKTLAKNDVPVSKILKLARENYLSAPARYIENDEEEGDNNYSSPHYTDILRPFLAITSTTEDLSDRYIMLQSSDGNFFRISKKLADLICCISGEEQDAGCKDQLQRWREKIASSPVAPSPGNFMDILSLLTSLQNDKN
ncbi:MAG: hypothetical protein JST17_12760 [Bacteroidetes bacterium]|nr:hypothetical protein [Bacteroidota bacterium]MBS1930516.1 hypothetical protein [Bacteroidota bacterium]